MRTPTAAGEIMAVNRRNSAWRRLGRGVLISTAGAFAWGEIGLHFLQPLFFLGISVGVLACASIWAVKEIRGVRREHSAHERIPEKQARKPRGNDRADRPFAL